MIKTQIVFRLVTAFLLLSIISVLRCNWAREKVNLRQKVHEYHRSLKWSQAPGNDCDENLFLTRLKNPAGQYIGNTVNMLFESPKCIVYFELQREEFTYSVQKVAIIGNYEKSVEFDTSMHLLDFAKTSWGYRITWQLPINNRQHDFELLMKPGYESDPLRPYDTDL